MTKKTILLLLLIISISSCKKEENTPNNNNNNNNNNTSVVQDKQNISNSFTSMEGCISTLKNGYGATATKNFLNFNEGEMYGEDWIDDMVDNIDDYLNLDAIDDNNKFDFTGNAGTYTWNPSLQDWTKQNNTNKIIIRFPSAEWEPSNNATFTLHSYSDVPLFYDGETIFAPTNITADLYVSGTNVFDINGSYSYDVGNATPIPININTTLLFNPFTITISGQRISPTNFQASISISNNNNCNTTLQANVRIAHSDYENLEETDIVEINTTVTHQNLKIQGYMNGSLFDYDDPSNTQINAMTDVDMYYSNIKIGELILQLNSNNDDKVFMVYKDGTSEDLEIYYDPFITNVEQILFPFLGDWD